MDKSGPKRDCPECGFRSMEVNYDKYVNATIWICKNCGEEIYICDNGC